MPRKTPELATPDKLAECYHAVGIAAVTAAAQYCGPLKKAQSEPAIFKMLQMVEPKSH